MTCDEFIIVRRTGRKNRERMSYWIRDEETNKPGWSDDKSEARRMSYREAAREQGRIHMIGTGRLFLEKVTGDQL